MMPDEQQYVMQVLRCSFMEGAGVGSYENLDPDLVAAYISREGILPTVWSSLDEWVEARSSLASQYYATISQIVNQAHEGERVLKAMAAAGLRCVPLKGWYLRSLYPHNGMRQMTDVDLLVGDYDYDAIRSVMNSLGFTPEVESESYEKHDVFHKGTVTVEVHRRLTDDSGPIRDWESCVWGRVENEVDGTLRMSPEDVYVHHYVHMRHDFVNGWFGLRRVVDAWLLEKTSANLDMDYVDEVLDSIGATRFRDRMRRLSRIVMGEEPLDEQAELLISYAFDCGIYGSHVSHKAGRIAQMSKGSATLGKVRSVAAAVFLPWGRMKAQFPELEHWPVLLPVCWAKRIVRYLRGGNLKRWSVMLDYSDVTDKDVERMRRVLEAGGC